MALLCCRSGLRRPRKQWRRKGNIELNMTECTVLLKQQSKKKNKLGKPRTNDRARHAAGVAALVATPR